MATEDGLPGKLAEQDAGKLTTQETQKTAIEDTQKLTTQETGKLTTDDTGEPVTEDTANSGSAEPTKEKRKKPPPKKPAIIQNCELCNVILTSQSIVDAHMASKKHTKRVQAAESMKTIFLQKKVAQKNTPLYRCDICNITLNSQQQKDLHLSGMKHNAKAKKHAEANEMDQDNNCYFVQNPSFKGTALASHFPGGAAKTNSSTVPPTDLNCTVCNITVNSVQQLTQHLSSKKHQMKENGLRRPAPYNHPRRGGLGRGAPGSFGAPGDFGVRGRGRGRGGGKLGGINSLKSNFQSAGFTSNFQGFGGQQSLKRDRSDISFGNGSSEDISNNSYYQGKKIPRGAQYDPFNNVDAFDNNPFRSGSNAYGGGNISFGAGNSAFSGVSATFGRGNKSSRGGFGRGNKSFGGGNNAFGGGSDVFGGAGDSDVFGGAGDSDIFGDEDDSFGGGSSFGVETSSYGGVESAFGDSPFGGFSSTMRGGFGRGSTRGGFERGRGFGHRGAFNTAV